MMHLGSSAILETGTYKQHKKRTLLAYSKPRQGVTLKQTIPVFWWPVSCSLGTPVITQSQIWLLASFLEDILCIGIINTNIKLHWDLFWNVNHSLPSYSNSFLYSQCTILLAWTARLPKQEQVNCESRLESRLDVKTRAASYSAISCAYWSQRRDQQTVSLEKSREAAWMLQTFGFTAADR